MDLEVLCIEYRHLSIDRFFLKVLVSQALKLVVNTETIESEPPESLTSGFIRCNKPIGIY
jgi:hypothetical protein